MIVDPWGKILATTEEREDVFVADVDLSLGGFLEKEKKGNGKVNEIFENSEYFLSLCVCMYAVVCVNVCI